MRADLHFHSIYSDGNLNIQELRDEILKAKLDVVALTDHDAILGIEELTKELEPYNVKVIPGLELSTISNDESIHVLGYFKSFEDIPEWFKEYLNSVRERRYNRMKEMTEKVNKMYGFGIDFETIVKKHPYMLERPHLADEIEAKLGCSRKEAFEKYIGNDCPCYIHSVLTSTKDGIEMLKKAGATVVLAHPYIYHHNNPIDLINLGVDGVEVFYSPTPARDYPKYITICNKNGLVMTGGSDFHRFEDYKHTDIGSSIYSSPELDKFLSKVNE